MKAVINIMQDGEFVQVHRSHTVNLEHVKCFYGRYLLMDDGESIPIGRDFMKQVHAKIILLGSRKKKK